MDETCKSTPDIVDEKIEACVDPEAVRDIMWLVIEDILDSLRLAGSVDTGTIEDYVVNYYGDS